jgi:hypothetical protein
VEWIAQMTDALLAQSAIDRLQSASYELILEGGSFRHHQKPGLDRCLTCESQGAEVESLCRQTPEFVTLDKVGWTNRSGQGIGLSPSSQYH